MSKHIIDGERVESGSSRLVQYARIDSTGRPHPQSKALQKQPHATDSKARTKRFLDLDRQKGT